jgi:hypothetical protein
MKRLQAVGERAEGVDKTSRRLPAIKSRLASRKPKSAVVDLITCWADFAPLHDIMQADSEFFLRSVFPVCLLHSVLIIMIPLPFGIKRRGEAARTGGGKTSVVDFARNSPRSFAS